MLIESLKKVLVLLIVIFCATIPCAFADEVTIISSGTCGANATWELNNVGTLTISGTGAIDDSSFSNATEIVNVTISNGITSIGNSSFQNCSNLKKVLISDSVTYIGSASFWGCENLAEITLGKGIIGIDDYAFQDCTSLAVIYLQKGVISLGESVFSGCISLVSVTIPEGITSLGESLFSCCSSLENIVIPNSVDSIGRYAFLSCDKLSNVDIGDNVTSIGYGAFDGCKSLTSIVIPDNVTSVGEYAFAWCTNLYYAKIGNGVSVVENYTFGDCANLAIVEIGNGVTTIKSEAFNDCRNLKNITFGAGITSISDYAFQYRYDLQNIMFLGEKMPTIGTNTFPSTYFYPTVYCREFSEIDFWATNKKYDIVYVDDLDASSTWAVTLPPYSYALAVGDELNIKADTFPYHSDAEIKWVSSDPEVVSVENGKLIALSVGEATITASHGDASDSVVVTTYMEVKSFDLAATELWVVSKTTEQLSILNISPAGVTDNFTWSSSDTSILTVDDNGTIYGLAPGDATVTVTSGSGVSRECLVHVCYPVAAIEFAVVKHSMLNCERVQLYANVTTRTDNIVNKLVTFASTDESIATVDENGLVTAVGEGVTTITATASSGVTASCEITVRNISVLMLPAKLQSIGAEAFVDTGIEKVVIPDGCASIGERAFASNETLLFVSIPDSVTYISDNAFEGCSNVSFICESENVAMAYAIEHSISYTVE